MKRPVIWLLILLLLLSIVPLGLVTAEAVLPDYYADSYYAELSAMYRRLRATEEPKIVLVGGSNIAFGVDVSLLEALLAQKGYDYRVCPLGLYGAVGTSAMLELARENLNPGDLVILAMEPDPEAMSAYFGATAFWKCAENAPELLFALNESQRSALAGNYLGYLQERWAYFRDGTAPLIQGVYARASFDEHCSMVYERPGNTMALGFDTTAPVDLAAVTVTAGFADQVNAFCDFARDRGASVYLSFSPVNRSALVDPSREAVLEYFDRCCDAFDCQPISDPNRYIYDSGWFYDSNFHLNSAGAVLRTRDLAQDLLSQLGCWEPVDCVVPEMPDSVAQMPTTSGDADCFAFSPVKDSAGRILGYRVAGLTEQGREKTSLTVPSSHQGMPVVGFASDALSGADRLEELTVPGSVEGLPDGLFRETNSLTRLILTHRGRVCDVTEHTFDNAPQVRVYVPEESYPLYRDGQGCETNPWDNYKDRLCLY